MRVEVFAGCQFVCRRGWVPPGLALRSVGASFMIDVAGDVLVVGRWFCDSILYVTHAAVPITPPLCVLFLHVRWAR